MLENKKRIYIIGTVGVPACYGGFESLVDNLLDYTPADAEYTVFCSAKKYGKRLETYKGAKLIYLDRDANGKDSILYDYESMKIAVRDRADIMLVLGVSGCIFLLKIRRAFKGKIITNIDGLEWKRDKWRFYAKCLLRWSERQAVRYSDIIIGDNRGITDYIRSAYGKIAAKKRVELIAYGGDQVTRVEDDSLFETYPFLRRDDSSARPRFELYAVTVCRIEPENNVHVILEAFAKMPERHLVIVGNWQKSDYGKSLKEKYTAFPSIHLLEPIYEPHTINWLRSNTALYIHGHSAGGTNPSLVEAMNLGLPILAFDCMYNRATTEEKALYWKTADDLAQLLAERSAEAHTKSESATAPSRLSEVAASMREIAARRYTWQNIAAQYNALF